MSFRQTSPSAWVVLTAILLSAAPPVAAQWQVTSRPFDATGVAASPPGTVGYGLQAGPLTGFSIKGYGLPGARGRFESIALTASLNLDDYLYAQVVLLDELPLRDSPVRVHLGPGLAAESGEDGLKFGVAGTAGLHFFKARLEIYLELSPRLFLTPSPEARPSAGIGFRFYP
ncbi:MAG: hypothetical protein HKN29_12875 [Rhodothermales bacterium]|nr:hypothetical protein [Rhodothermales bacterium]